MMVPLSKELPVGIKMYKKARMRNISGIGMLYSSATT